MVIGFILGKQFFRGGKI